MKHASDERVARTLVAAMHAARLTGLVISGWLVASTWLSGFDGPRRIWFTPDVASPDMIELFQAPDQWTFARDHVSVFKFYEGQLLEPAPANVITNHYAALRGVDAFRKLTVQWHKQIAIEAPAVKPFYCGASGMREPIRNTFQAVANVMAAGGRVELLAMDEPFAATFSAPACGGADFAPTLTRLEQYVRTLHAVLRGVEIGDIEPYPFLSESQIEQAVFAMRERGIAPAFLHLDVDLNALRRDGRYAGYDVANDLRRLRTACEAQGIRFGFIFWGRDTSSDAVYYADAMQRVQLVKDVFGAWEDLPDDLIFQSFAVSANGEMVVPLNLPETGANTHTNLIDRGLLVLQGAMPSGTTRPRR